MDRKGSAATPNASRYLQQLCKHWGHRFTAEFDAEKGTVDFGEGQSVDLRADASALHFVIHGPEAELDEFEGVVEEHVNRFAHKEGALPFTWEK